jgi:hypothetical protein
VLAGKDYNELHITSSGWMWIKLPEKRKSDNNSSEFGEDSRERSKLEE